MHGLRMIRDYLEEILIGSKNNDVRSYPTSIRGKIALIDSSSDKIIGLVELVDVKPIGKEEYIAWHKSGRFAVMEFDVPEGTYYSYEFRHPERLAKPIKVKKEKKAWVEIPEELCESFFKVDSLF